MTRGVRGVKLLEGVRGAPRADFVAIEDVLLRVSRLVCDFPDIAELDINPLLVYGDRVVAVDGRAMVDRGIEGWGIGGFGGFGGSEADVRASGRCFRAVRRMATKIATSSFASCATAWSVPSGTSSVRIASSQPESADAFSFLQRDPDARGDELLP